MTKAMMTIVVLTVCVAAVSAGAEEYVYVPSDHDIYDLPHGKYYTWGMAKAWGENEVVTGASLYFKSLRNWNNSDNDLWVHLLDNDAGTTGLTSGNDNQNVHADQFLGQGVELVHYHNLSSSAADRTHVFTGAQYGALDLYAGNNGFFAIGLDPDCHFYNCGVTLTVTTKVEEENEVPEPATLGLLGVGAACIVVRRTRRKAVA